MKTALEILSGAAVDSGVCLMLIGGYALPGHGVVRQKDLGDGQMTQTDL